MKKLLFVLTLNIVWGSCWVSSANAGVITMGTWTNMDTNAAAFWDNSSWDGPGKNVAFAFDRSEFALVRPVGPTAILYFLGVEDIPRSTPSDHDYNDYTGHARGRKPTPTPEPGTLALILCGGLVAFRKVRSGKS